MKTIISRGPLWHRAVYALASAPLLLFTLMGWEHGAYSTFGVGFLVCLGLAVWPLRLGAAILFWPFAAGAVLYGVLLIKDILALSTGSAPSVLLDADDSIVFVVLEVILIGVTLLLFRMWRPKQRQAAPRASRC